MRCNRRKFYIRSGRRRISRDILEHIITMLCCFPLSDYRLKKTTMTKGRTMVVYGSTSDRDRVLEIGFLGTRNQSKNEFKAFFCQMWWVISFRVPFGKIHFWKTIKHAKKLAKNEEKPCSTCLKPISPRHFQNPKPRFQVPEPSLLAL